MNRERPNRRQVLTALGVGITAALTGCFGNGETNESQANSPKADTAVAPVAPTPSSPTQEEVITTRANMTTIYKCGGGASLSTLRVNDTTSSDAKIIDFSDLSPGQQRVFEEALRSKGHMTCVPDDVDTDVWDKYGYVRYHNQLYGLIFVPADFYD